MRDPQTATDEIPAPTATIQDALAALRTTAHLLRWYVSGSGAIFGVRDGRLYSPLTAAAEAAAGKTFPLEAQRRAGTAMGLSSEDTDAIIAASRKWGQARLRQALLDTLRLADR
jgi:hypothetical protein